MLRLSLDADLATLRLYGRVAGPDLAVLARGLETRLASWARHDAALNLDGVSFVDDAGLALLEGWSRRGLRLQGGTPFVRALLAEAGLSAT